MKEILFSDDRTVTKIIHNDNSETAIKTVSSCDTHMKENGEYVLNPVDRNKYSIFVSDSAGCYMACKFCYLTLKNMKFGKLSSDDIVANIKEALLARIVTYPDIDLERIDEKFVKLCWMGMGDAFINTQRSKAATIEMLDFIMEQGHAVGLDGVDMSTVVPKVKDLDETFAHLYELEELLQKYELNPHNDVLVHRSEYSNTPTSYPSRSRFRLFYSLHSAIQKTRNELIPNAMSIDEALPALIDYSKHNKHNLIIHHMFIDGFNDSDEEIDALIRLIKAYGLHQYELRVLRYNTCEVSTFIHESNRFKDIIKRLHDVHPFVKVQISAGSEVKAACGQFLVTD
jgi:adenine C2-methylase RlmN of 23S rRNA A2503 and tRNA A37